MLDLIVSVPDHCLSFYFSSRALGTTGRSYVPIVSSKLISGPELAKISILAK